MAKLIKATVNFVATRATKETCDQVGKPYGTIEVMDPDNIRYTFVETMEEAEKAVREYVEDQLGLSGGIALGNVDIETIDSEAV